MAGYSGTPLAKKLGIVEGAVVHAIGAPKQYESLLAPLPRGASVRRSRAGGKAFTHLFAASRTDLGNHLTALRRSMDDDGVVWVSWPKKSSGVATDITEDVIREVALPLGFVDVKVCAIDETWSGLKLVVRRELRR